MKCSPNHSSQLEILEIEMFSLFKLKPYECNKCVSTMLHLYQMQPQKQRFHLKTCTPRDVPEEPQKVGTVSAKVNLLRWH